MLCLCVLPFCIYSTFFPCLAYSYSLRMETAYTCETSLHSHRTTRHQTPEGCHLHGHCLDNLKSHTTEMKCQSKWVDFVRNGWVTRVSGRILRVRSNKQKDSCNKWSGQCWKCGITMNASRTFGRKGFIKSVYQNVFVRRISDGVFG